MFSGVFCFVLFVTELGIFSYVILFIPQKKPFEEEVLSSFSDKETEARRC